MTSWELLTNLWPVKNIHPLNERRGAYCNVAREIYKVGRGRVSVEELFHQKGPVLFPASEERKWQRVPYQSEARAL